MTGGQAWANLHYLLGLRALGHDVYYLEDVGPWSQTYDWQTQSNTESLDYPAEFIGRALAPHGFGDNWIYRTSDDSRGMSLSRLLPLCEMRRLAADPGSTDARVARGVRCTAPPGVH